MRQVGGDPGNRRGAADLGERDRVLVEIAKVLERLALDREGAKRFRHDRQREVDQLGAVRRARHAAHDDVDTAAGDERYAAVRIDGDVGDFYAEHRRKLGRDIDVEA